METYLRKSGTPFFCRFLDQPLGKAVKERCTANKHMCRFSIVCMYLVSTHMVDSFRRMSSQNFVLKLELKQISKISGYLLEIHYPDTGFELR